MTLREVAPSPRPRRTIPFLLVGDAPESRSGLGRILRDLVRHLEAVKADLAIDPHVCAWTSELPAPVDRFTDTETWGRQAIADTWLRRWGMTPGILFTIFDPARCYEYLDLPMTKWGYFPIDGADWQGTIGGPAAETVTRYDRVLAYSPYGQRVMATVRPGLPESEWLPHGMDAVWTPTCSTVDEAVKVREQLRVPQGRLLLGCVATNQSRKDLGVVFAAVRRVADAGHDVHLWLHTDALIRAWSIPQLADTYRLADRLSVSFHWDDATLAAIYRTCHLTIAPGRGEGFGYPIVESQLCGTLCLAMDYAGGADFTHPSGLVAPSWSHAEGLYAILRPVWDVNVLAQAIERLIATRPGIDEGQLHSAYLSWDRLWPAWQTWIEEGLAAYRAAEERV